MARFAVAGATSWGLTLAWLLHRNGHAVTVTVRTPQEAQMVKARGGIERLPELKLDAQIEIQAPPFGSDFDGLVLAVPARAVEATVRALALTANVPVLSAIKGFAPGADGSGRMISDVLQEMGWDESRICALSGPNLAHEVIRGLPAAAVVAGTDLALSEAWQRWLSQGMFRVYRSDDLVGVELAGALKNVIAIAAGAAWGLNFGANAVATIMTRGLAEIARLGIAAGADAATFQGLAGVGDLAATCFSPLSRNRRFGELLGQGRSVDEAMRTIGEVVEGAGTAGLAVEMGARQGVEMPIAEAVSRVVRGDGTVMEAMAALLARPLRAEASNRG